jgi:anti-anti-sigma factor
MRNGNLTLKEDEKDGVAVLYAEGVIHVDNSPELRRRLLKLLNKKSRRILISLEKVEKIDTSGLATLVEFVQTAESQGNRKVVVCYLNEKMTDTMSLRQVESVLNIQENEEDGFNQLEEAGREDDG